MGQEIITSPVCRATVPELELARDIGESDVHVSGSLRLAWFTDPHGNLHAMGNG